MGRELEFKLHLDGPAALARVLSDAELNECRLESWCERSMTSIYFDTEDRALSARRWTLRFRQEGDCPVVCLKMPTQEHGVRWELEAQAPEMSREALETLVQAGAPEQLPSLWPSLRQICGATFTRRSAMLLLRDQSRAELAGDCGLLRGATQTLPFAELELELYAGAPEETAALVQRLCQRYGLHEEPRSKFARASALR